MSELKVFGRLVAGKVLLLTVPMGATTWVARSHSQLALAWTVGVWIAICLLLFGWAAIAAALEVGRMHRALDARTARLCGDELEPRRQS